MDIKTRVNRIRGYFLKRGETLAVAESVTCGRIQSAFSKADEASLFFQGGISVYNVGQKARHLDIDPIYGLSCNCVSERVAKEMAVRVCDLFCCDWGIGIVGYASPVPELKINRLYAYYAFSRRGEVCFSKEVKARRLPPETVQAGYVDSCLEAFDTYLWNSLQS